MTATPDIAEIKMAGTAAAGLLRLERRCEVAAKTECKNIYIFSKKNLDG